jgi:hypothetical protein
MITTDHPDYGMLKQLWIDRGGGLIPYNGSLWRDVNQGEYFVMVPKSPDNYYSESSVSETFGGPQIKRRS